MSNLKSTFSNLLIITGISLLCGILFSFIAILAVAVIYNIPIGEVMSVVSNLENPANINKAKVILFFNSFGLFVVPPTLYVLIQKDGFSRFFKFKIDQNLNYIPWLLIFFFVSMPIINISAEINEWLVLPDFLSDIEIWMRNAENQAMDMTKSLLKMDSISDLLINIFLIGVVPAIGEELMFRGVIQQTLTKNSQNHHLGIWLTAIIFSAIHFQFYGFIPRMLLGAYFGYLFYWSKNIWLPIIAHFINNSMAVIAAYYLGSSALEEDLEKVGTIEQSAWISLVAMVLFGALFWQFKGKLTPNKSS